MMNDREFPTQAVLVVFALAGVLILGSCTSRKPSATNGSEDPGSKPKAEQAQEESAEPKLAEVTLSITGMT